MANLRRDRESQDFCFDNNSGIRDHQVVLQALVDLCWSLLARFCFE